MFKKVISTVCIIAIMFSFAACSSNNSGEEKSTNEITVNQPEETKKQETVETKKQETANFAISNASSSNDYDELEEKIDKDIEDTVSALNSEYEQLKSEIDTYAKFLNSADKMEAFYEKIYKTNYALCVRMCEYSLNYAQLIINSPKSNDEKYDDIRLIYDIVYDDMGKEIYDEIYDGLLDDMYDDYYDGILEQAYRKEEYSEYKEWSDCSTDEYRRWSDTSSDIYKDWSDLSSDVYSFYSDLSSAIYSGNIERAEKKIDDFSKDVSNLKEKVE